MMFYRKYGKRGLDIILAAIILVIISPIMLLVWIAVRISMGKPSVFRQLRAGYQEKTFTIYKFRTMNDRKDENGKFLCDDQRLTKLGRFLRRTSLDEIPQLLNILKGDMSFVGPRPLYPRYLPYYREDERCRHSVLPGITGLAQINGRNNLSWDARLQYDVQYARQQSLAFDIGIVIQTIVKVLNRSDVTEASDVTEGTLDGERIRKQMESQAKGETKLDGNKGSLDG